jgi:PadR family transcriptional regulator, regulatory protein AphA
MASVKLEFILFGALLQQPQTGYELQRFMEAAGRFMRANTSMTQVYRSLRAMEERGWLAYEIEPRVGAQDAKRYRLTSDGEATFFGWLREAYQPSELPDASFAAQLRYRAQYLGCDAAVELLDVEIAHRRRQIARNRDRDRTERYAPDAPVHVELTSALMEWEHRRGADFMDRHVQACVDLRARLVAGLPPAEDVPMLLQPSVRDDLATAAGAS